MSDQFNAYLKWLGIPLKHQPPNHYRLLGIEPLEADLDVIENAADRQMAHVRNFSSGKRMELAQQLLQELSAARVILLTNEKKQAYDKQLRKTEAINGQKALQQKAAIAARNMPPKPPSSHAISSSNGQAAPGVPRAAPLPAAPRPAAMQAQPLLADSAPVSPVMVSSQRPSVARRKKQVPWLLLGVAGFGVVAMCLFGAIALPSLLGPVEEPVARTNEPTSLRVEPSASTTNTQNNNTGGSVVPPVDTPPESSGSNTDGEGDPPTSDPDKPVVDEPAEVPAVVPDPTDDKTPTEPENPAPETSESGVASRPKPPAPAVQAEIVRKVRSIYDFSSESADARQTLARKLLADGVATTDNADDRYVLLSTAADTAADAGDLTTAMEAIDLIEKQYQTQTTPLRVELVKRAVRLAPANDKAETIRSSLAVIDAAIERSHYSEAEQLTIDLLNSARRLGDRDLNTALIDRRRSAATLGKMYDEALKGVATLAKDPDDAAANTAVGSFWAFAKFNWEKAMPHLEKGSDAELANIARQELAAPSEPDKLADLANAWFVDSKTTDSPIREAMLRRSQHWYQAALEDATGLTRTTVERRLEEIDKTLTSVSGVSAKPTAQMAQIIASCDSGFEMYLNGELLLRGQRFDVGQTTRELKSGDVLMVRGSNLRSEKGFAAVVKFENGKSIATGQADTWRLFTPTDQTAWFDPRGVGGIGPPLGADGTRHLQVKTDSGVDCASIWSGNQFLAFLLLQIP